MASSLLANGQWRKASLVRSLVATALWSLSAVDAHWCRLATTGFKRYIPFSWADPHLIAAGLNEDDPLYSETNEGEEEEDQVEISSNEPLDGLGLDEVDMAKIKEALQHISQGLDMPSHPSAGLGASRAQTPIHCGLLKWIIHLNKLHGSTITIHKQPQNAVILQPLASWCWRDLLAGPRGDPPLFDTNGVVRIEVDKWLKKI
ncbi:hypothetical protein BJY52DRAFT_1228302 [Lactarius psammicola]|nr:hypothetical protein BJY52DRAFT_1228302 [Lactarius psammicola]